MSSLITFVHAAMHPFDSIPSEPVPIPDPIPRPQPMPDPPPDEEPIKMSHR